MFRSLSHALYLSLSLLLSAGTEQTTTVKRKSSVKRATSNAPRPRPLPAMRPNTPLGIGLRGGAGGKEGPLFIVAIKVGRGSKKESKNNAQQSEGSGLVGGEG